MDEWASGRVRRVHIDGVMPRDLVVIGGSAGALEPLLEILEALPVDFPAAIVVVLHTTHRQNTSLPA